MAEIRKPRRPKLEPSDLITKTSFGDFESDLPSNVDAEKAILGSILLDNTHLAEAELALQASDFVLASHRVIWERMRAINGQGRQIDILVLANEMGQKGEIEKTGGLAYLAGLTEGLPRRLNIQEYIKIVADKSLLRQVMTASQKAIDKALNRDGSGQEIISELTSHLIEIAANSKSVWKVGPKREVLVGALDFMASGSRQTDWAVEGIIQRGGNGLIVGDPGSRKSFTALDLLLHMIAAKPWLGMDIKQRVRCALISREDHHGLTQNRMLKIVAGLPSDVADSLDEINLNEWFYLNSRKQTETFSLQREQDVMEIIEAFQEKGIEFAVFDVFRRLWDGDENDNREVAQVLSVLTRIQTECKCSVALVHHLNKSDGPIFSRTRGATSIHGWREWAIGLSVVNPEAPKREHVIKAEFETKAGAPDPVFFQLEGFSGSVEIRQCDEPQRESKKSKKFESSKVKEVFY